MVVERERAGILSLFLEIATQIEIKNPKFIPQSTMATKTRPIFMNMCVYIFM